MQQFMIGIDEAGRGPLAGPVAVGIALVPTSFDWLELPGVTDSKKLTEATREKIANHALLLKRDAALDFQTALVGASVIDSIGIVPAITKGLTRALTQVLERNGISPDEVRIVLDGGLRAPDIFQHQETIVRGDSAVKEIGLASILAKVRRDRYMVRAGDQYPEYGLARHKGYGTKVHRNMIEKYGCSPIHRRSFCTNIVL